jgi:hypothetical protein
MQNNQKKNTLNESAVEKLRKVVRQILKEEIGKKDRVPFTPQEIELINKCVSIYSDEKVKLYGDTMLGLPRGSMYNDISQINKNGVNSYTVRMYEGDSNGIIGEDFEDFNKLLFFLKSYFEELVIKHKDIKNKQDNKYMDYFYNRGKLKGLNVVGKVDLKENNLLDESKGLYDNYIEDYNEGKSTNLLITLRVDNLSQILNNIKQIFNNLSRNVSSGGMYVYTLTSANYNPEVNFLFLRFKVTYSDDYYDLSSVTSSKIINEVINSMLQFKQRNILYKIIHKTNMPQNISDIKVNNLFLR